MIGAVEHKRGPKALADIHLATSEGHYGDVGVEWVGANVAEGEEFVHPLSTGARGHDALQNLRRLRSFLPR